ncbi:MAG: hypothetical protein ACYS0G_14125 [Planctomycetota bacterium]|jgi:hypothetical protein
MSGPLLLTLIIVAALAESFVILWAIVRFGWKPLADVFPPQPSQPDAVVRRFRSFRVGVVNFGFSMHVAVDERHLHLETVALFRWFGARPVSVPWESIRIQKRSRWGRWITAKVGPRTITGPAWCLELAEPTPDTNHASAAGNGADGDGRPAPESRDS